MKIFAIRDRLIGYFQKPFAETDTGPVLAAIAQVINTGDTSNAIAQAPHHFELWELGTVTETGHIEGRPEFIADLSTLIRTERNATGPNSGQIPSLTSGGIRPAGSPAQPSNASERPSADPAQAEDRQGAENRQRPDGSTGEPGLDKH